MSRWPPSFDDRTFGRRWRLARSASSRSGARVQADQRRQQDRPGQEEEASLLAKTLLQQFLQSLLHCLHPAIDASEGNLKLPHFTPHFAHVRPVRVHALHPGNEVTSRFRAERLLEFPLKIWCSTKSTRR